MPVGIAYAIWAGLGIVLIAIIGAIWLNSAFKESSLDDRYDDISQEKLTEESPLPPAEKQVE